MKELVSDVHCPMEIRIKISDFLGVLMRNATTGEDKKSFLEKTQNLLNI